MTLRPFGLNEEKPGGVSSSTSSMCRRSMDLQSSDPAPVIYFNIYIQNFDLY